MDSKGKSELAKRYFEQGYNCAQSVLLAFVEETGLTQRQAARLASTFGGGMGRMREVCGAVSGMFMVEGLLKGYDDPKAKEEKREVYACVRDLADRFREKNHSIICRELLIDVETAPGAEPEERTDAYYERRPCGCYVADAAAIIADRLNEADG